MSPSAFTTVIVTYNSAGEILSLLQDIQNYTPDSQIIVIDNASLDETVILIQEHFPQIHLVKNSTNVGYAKAVNQGFRLCHTEYVLLLNPDIRISNPQLFAELVGCLKNSHQTAAVAPLQFKDDDGRQRLNFTWSYMTPATFRLYVSFLRHHKKPPAEPMQVTFLNAGCLLIRRSAFEQVGRLNEKYFLYGEEPDLFLKFRRFGFQCFLLPGVGVTHYRERSFRTQPAPRRLQLRFLSARNVVDALFHGWAGILLDQLVIKSLQFLSRKRQTTYKKRTFTNLG